MDIVKKLVAALVLLPVLDLFAYTAGQDCNEFVNPRVLKTDGSRLGTIQMPTIGYNYKSNQFCEWTIETDHSDYVVQLEVTRCTLEGKDIYGTCKSDYVDVFDNFSDKSHFLGRFCGWDQGKSYKTAGSKMTVRFYSDDNLEFSGFLASYQAVPADTSAENEPEKLILGLAVGIPVSVLVVATVVIIIVSIIHHRRKKAEAYIASLSETSAQLNNFQNAGFNDESQPTSLSHCAGGHMYIDYSVNENRDFNPYSTSTSMPIVFLRNFQEDSGNSPQTSHNARSCTPPPSYESLGISEVGQNRTSISPPSYEVAVKYNIDYSTV